MKSGLRIEKRNTAKFRKKRNRKLKSSLLENVKKKHIDNNVLLVKLICVKNVLHPFTIKLKLK